VRGRVDDRRQLEARVEQAPERASARLVVADRADSEEGMLDSLSAQSRKLVRGDDRHAEHFAAGARGIVVGERDDLEPGRGERRVENRLCMAAGAETDEANGHALILV